MKPSEAVQEGKCPSCLGLGWVERVVPVVGTYPCSTCYGSGQWPPPDGTLALGFDVPLESSSWPGIGAYGLDHRLIGHAEAAALLADSKARRVDRTHIGDQEVSTVFLVFDHGFGGEPVLYETMIFGADGAPDGCWRYRTREAAVAGHEKVVAALQQGAKP